MNCSRQDRKTTVSNSNRSQDNNGVWITVQWFSSDCWEKIQQTQSGQWWVQCGRWKTDQMSQSCWQEMKNLLITFLLQWDRKLSKKNFYSWMCLTLHGFMKQRRMLNGNINVYSTCMLFVKSQINIHTVAFHLKAAQYDYSPLLLAAGQLYWNSCWRWDVWNATSLRSGVTIIDCNSKRREDLALKKWGSSPALCKSLIWFLSWFRQKKGTSMRVRCWQNKRETGYLVIIHLKLLILKDLLGQANWDDVWDV